MSRIWYGVLGPWAKVTDFGRGSGECGWSYWVAGLGYLMTQHQPNAKMRAKQTLTRIEAQDKSDE